MTDEKRDESFSHKDGEEKKEDKVLWILSGEKRKV